VNKSRRIRMEGHIARMVGEQRGIQGFVGKLGGKRQLLRLKRK
jgi:hypothetical protein